MLAVLAVWAAAAVLVVARVQRAAINRMGFQIAITLTLARLDLLRESSDLICNKLSISTVLQTVCRPFHIINLHLDPLLLFNNFSYQCSL